MNIRFALVSVSLSPADADELVSSTDFQSVSDVLDERERNMFRVVPDPRTQMLEELEAMRKAIDTATSREEWVSLKYDYMYYYEELHGTTPPGMCFLSCPFE